MRAIVGFAVTAIVLVIAAAANAVSISEYSNGYGSSTTPYVPGFSSTAGLNGGTGWTGAYYMGPDHDGDTVGVIPNHVPGSNLLLPNFYNGISFVPTIGYQSTGNNTGASDGLIHGGPVTYDTANPILRNIGGLTGTIWMSLLVNNSVVNGPGALRFGFNGSTGNNSPGLINFTMSTTGGSNLNGNVYSTNYMDAWNNTATVDLILMKIAGVGGGGTVGITVWQDPVDVSAGEGGLSLPTGSGFSLMSATIADSALGGALNNFTLLLGGNGFVPLSLLSVDAIRISNDATAFGFVTTGIAVVPEPATLSLLALGGLALLRRRT